MAGGVAVRLPDAVVNVHTPAIGDKCDFACEESKENLYSLQSSELAVAMCAARSLRATWV